MDNMLMAVLDTIKWDECLYIELCIYILNIKIMNSEDF
jgi:hypothetical protein